MTSLLNQARRSGSDQLPKIGVQVNQMSGLLECGAEGLQETICFRDDIKAEFVVLEIPGGAGRPGCVLVIPVSFDPLEIVITQPLDARRKVGR